MSSNIQDYINKIEKIRVKTLKYIDESDNVNENFNDLQIIFQKQNLQNDNIELNYLLHLLSRLSSNHYRTPHFFEKIENVILNLKEKIKQTFSNDKLFTIFKEAKRILLFLFEEQMILIDDQIIKKISSDLGYQNYFLKEIKNFDGEKINQEIPENFDEKRKIGENDSYICSLIRNDLIEEFIIYVNKNQITLSSQIEQSIYETNSFLATNRPTLIEYAAFFGSIQIFQYLRFNNVQLTESLWIYAIHGRNAEIIHLLEECNVKPSFNDYNYLFNQSIKCNHNDIANYIQNKYLPIKSNTEYWGFYEYCFENSNFEFIQNNLINENLFYYACQFNFYFLVEILLKEKRIDVNKKIVSIYF